MKYYMITSGEYSDYGVEAVTDDLETAKAWAKAANEDLERGGGYKKYEIEEVMSIKKGEKPHKISRAFVTAELLDGGEVGELREQIFSNWFTTRLTRPKTRYVRAPYHNSRGGRIEIEAPTLEAARKVYSEKVAMWKAGSWGGPKYEEIKE